MPSVSKAQPFHWNVKNLLGQRFGKLLVVSEAGRNHKRMVVWNCQCDCGKQTTRQGSTLLAGKSTSCGCQWHSVESRQKIARAQIKSGSLMRREYRHARDGALKRGHAWALSEADFACLVVAVCAYCGAEPCIERVTKYERGLFNGIDRADNSTGYVQTNCVPCCKVCNYMKRALSVEEFLAHVYLITCHQEESSRAIA